MTVFAVISTTVSFAEKLNSTIETTYPDSHLRVGPANWLVADSVTPKEVSDKLKISEGDNGSGLVVAISGYFGRASPNIWAWIKAKWEATTGA